MCLQLRSAIGDMERRHSPGQRSFSSYIDPSSGTTGEIVILDAAGLSLFAMVRTQKALAFRMHPLVAVLLGTFTGVGGGTVRDVLLAQVPTVLRSDVYATAALAGAILMTVAYRAGLPQMWAATVGGLLCFSLRVVSVSQHWSLPRVLGE